MSRDGAPVDVDKLRPPFALRSAVSSFVWEPLPAGASASGHLL